MARSWIGIAPCSNETRERIPRGRRYTTSPARCSTSSGRGNGQRPASRRAANATSESPSGRYLRASRGVAARASRSSRRSSAPPRITTAAGRGTSAWRRGRALDTTRPSPGTTRQTRRRPGPPTNRARRRRGRARPTCAVLGQVRSSESVAAQFILKTIGSPPSVRTARRTRPTARRRRRRAATAARGSCRARRPARYPTKSAGRPGALRRGSSARRARARERSRLRQTAASSPRPGSGTARS